MRRSLGKRGEELARSFLQKAGYRILAMNYRTKLGEVDIIAKDGDVIVFVEVKTRSGSGFGSPFEAVTAKKQRQMTKVALEYLARNKLHDRPARFDVVAVTMRGGTPHLEIVRNAFEVS